MPMLFYAIGSRILSYFSIPFSHYILDIILFSIRLLLPPEERNPIGHQLRENLQSNLAKRRSFHLQRCNNSTRSQGGQHPVLGRCASPRSLECVPAFRWTFPL